MTDAERVQDFQRKLYLKAKQDRKSQRKCKFSHQGAFGVLVSKYGLKDPGKYASC